jgi:arginyl-tRNA synthetase
MKSLTARLTEIMADAFAACGYDPGFGVVSRSDRPDLGQFQCNGALSAARAHRTVPTGIANSVVRRLAADETFSQVSIAGPGFINLTLSDEFLARHIEAMDRSGQLGVPEVEQPLRVIVDYGGANVAKPMHVGHLRAAIIGESLKRIGRFLGHDVLGDVHLGDWGLQMGMLISELRRRAPELPYFDASFTGPYPAESPVTLDDLEELYPTAAARARDDPAAMEEARAATFELQQGRPGYYALWRHFHDVSVAELKADYATLDVHFDLWLGESDTQEWIPGMIERLRDGGLARESQGALVVDVAAAEEESQTPPLMLLKSDGAVLYGTTDLATIDQRVQELGAQLVIYVVDSRQADHFRQVFGAARRSGIAPESVMLEHAGFGTMNGKDGKPFKTREGGVMKLKDLMRLVTDKAMERMAEADVAEGYDDAERAEVARMVGMATLKYADLMNQRTKDYVFDLERFSSFEGRTGPYLLYTAVRAKSILRKAAARGLEPGSLLPPASDAERGVMLALAELPDAVNRAWDARMPSQLCEFGYVLATAFNRFYHEHHILTEPNLELRGSWLALTRFCVSVLERTLDLLGVAVPERM